MLVIFDCDGVLVETETIQAQVLCDCLQPLGINITVAEVLMLFRGKPIAVCAEQVAALLADSEPYQSWPESERNAFASDFWVKVQQETLVAFSAGVQPIAGVRNVLESLTRRGIAFCVASNGRHEKMQNTLTHTGLAEFFPQANRFSATDVDYGKPAPDLFLYAANKMGVKPGDCSVIEDSPSGARAARLAGMSLLGYCPHDPMLPNAHVDDLMRAEGARVFRHMDELLSLL
ncbi:HAD family hydrolase [Gilvimarinus polysaccharolyticus]|uniref:HAD family hydrolase n=1 Tax=Gilvimarinus polysaccharolyticus TaxID=863921 RepID=UPI0006732323|nr:HAD family phosphatase [Gilvimarinus polysaccharolyticus]